MIQIEIKKNKQTDQQDKDKCFCSFGRYKGRSQVAWFLYQLGWDHPHANITVPEKVSELNLGPWRVPGKLTIQPIPSFQTLGVGTLPQYMYMIGEHENYKLY